MNNDAIVEQNESVKDETKVLAIAELLCDLANKHANSTIKNQTNDAETATNEV